MEALAFDENAPEFVDETVPDAERQEEKIKKYVDDIKEEFGSDTSAAQKRSTNASSEGRASKMPKAEPSLSDIESAVIGGRANSCTVRNLKDFIKSKGRSPSDGALKKDLVAMAESLVN